MRKTLGDRVGAPDFNTLCTAAGVVVFRSRVIEGRAGGCAADNNGSCQHGASTAPEATCEGQVAVGARHP